MKYKEYINLGFKRIDISDSVEFENTGYKGFILRKTLSKKVLIEVNYGELDNPKLYILKSEYKCYIIPLTEIMLKELLK